MSENFGLKIGLEGEREFKKSLAEINNSFKVLGSEMKLVDSQFDKNDRSAEALTARNQVLNKEIEQQKQKIETLRSALANAAESFGENDRRTQSWQIQLNNAQAALNGMESELNSNNTALEKADKGFDEAGDEAKDFSNSVKKAADTSEDADGKLSKLGDTAKKIGAALGAAAAAVGTACVAAGKKLWDMANEVGSAGDQIDKTSQKIGISAESYQKWGYVFERCGADVNNLQTGMKKLSTVITDAAGGSDSAAEKLSAVGLSIEELNGKSQDEQLSMVITALQGMEAGAERTAAANDLLGKSAVDMAAVLNTSVEETERLKQEAEDYGMVMSNEAVAASAAFEDSLTKLSHTAGGLKNRMVGELLPGITQITDGLADLLAGNEQAADELKSGVTSVIDTNSKFYKNCFDAVLDESLFLYIKMRKIFFICRKIKENPTYPLNHLALDFGYSAESAMSRDFRHIVDFTPKQVLKENKSAPDNRINLTVTRTESVSEMEEIILNKEALREEFIEIPDEFVDIQNEFGFSMDTCNMIAELAERLGMPLYHFASSCFDQMVSFQSDSDYIRPEIEKCIDLELTSEAELKAICEFFDCKYYEVDRRMVWFYRDRTGKECLDNND